MEMAAAKGTGLLSPEQIEEFQRRGVLVISNFLSADEVYDARKGFHEYLLSRGIDPANLEDTACRLAELSSTGGSGGVIDAFYQEWKLKLNQSVKAVAIMSELWAATFANCESPYNHPFGVFPPEEALMYIDRVCYRVPDSISALHCSETNKKRCLQRSLTPHIDCCPHRMFQDIGEHKYSKWRPIQAFIALTDTTSRNEGGFEACPGLHVEFDEWVKNRIPNPIKQKTKCPVVQKSRLKKGACENTSSSSSVVLGADLSHLEDEHSGKIISKLDDNSVENLTGSEPPCVGQFTPIRMIEDSDIIKRFEHIPCKAGDMVFWDYRIPHSNSYKNESNITREAVYIGLLPNVELNAAYIKDQLTRYKMGIVPIDQWHSHNEPQICNFEFSSLGRKMMGIDSWDVTLL